MSAYGFGGMIKKLKANPKTIVFTEGTDARILEAASRLLASNFLTPILIGNEDEIINAAEEEGYNIRGAQIIDPLKYDRFDEMVDLFCELRKSKGMTPEKARPILSQANYFGTMLVKMGVADCLLGGATYSTADTVRPALQIIKTKPGNSIVSSCFILVRAAATGGRERSQARLLSARRYSVSIPRLLSFPSPQQDLLRILPLQRSRTLQRRLRRNILIFRSTARCSSTQQFLPA